MARLHSNPVRVFVGWVTTEGYNFIPKGNTPFCVRASRNFHIPINMLVFSDTEENAVREVKDALQWAKTIYHREKESAHPDSKSRKEFKTSMDDLLYGYTWEVNEVGKNQLFKIGWASNDTIV